MNKVKFKKLQPTAVLPAKGTTGAIAYDLVVPINTPVRRGRQIIPLHFSMEMPPEIEGKIEPRSGHSIKGLPVYYTEFEEEPVLLHINADVLVGKVDPDYRGPVGVILNVVDSRLLRNPNPFILRAGTKLAQLTFYKVEHPEIEETDELSSTDRGEGGFGSTGSHIE